MNKDDIKNWKEEAVARAEYEQFTTKTREILSRRFLEELDKGNGLSIKALSYKCESELDEDQFALILLNCASMEPHLYLSSLVFNDDAMLNYERFYLGKIGKTGDQ